MSEHSTTTTQAPDGLIGLATGLGALRSDLNHHIDDQNRAFDELRSSHAERFTSLETTVSDLTARLDELVSIIEKAAEAEAEYLSQKSSHPATSTPKVEDTAPPARKPRENNKAFYERLIEWANERGTDAPPKLKSTEFPNAYDKRIREWGQEIGT